MVERIKRLLLQCLEEHYGSLDKVIHQESASVDALREIALIVDRNRELI
ncbi:MAG: hypothetical protein GF411_14725 [Candidatus Lokiarchaeota archaeon]|nr:hypothetical protein [Candidatus Lokiarchaeota archaeon]